MDAGLQPSYIQVPSRYTKCRQSCRAGVLGSPYVVALVLAPFLKPVVRAIAMAFPDNNTCEACLVLLPSLLDLLDACKHHDDHQLSGEVAV